MAQAKNMPLALERYYAENIEFIRASIRQFFPDTYSNAWLDSTIGKSRYPRNEESLQRYFQAPNNLYLSRHGKALRSVLAAMTLEAFGKKSADYALYLAMIEVVEDTTIAWDDVWDGSDMRRGGPTMHVAYGIPTALNASTAAYDYAYHVFNSESLNIDDDTRNKVLNALTWDMIHLPVGQAEELYWTDHRVNDVTEDQYLQETMSRCAFLSFRGPVKIAAILAGASEEAVLAMSEYGENLGLAYHLHGDNLNLRSTDLGKVWAEDITTGRRTLLILHTLKVASREDRRRLIEILNSNTDDMGNKKEAVNFMYRYGAIEHCEQRALELGRDADACIERAGISGIYKEYFNAVTEFACRTRTL